MISFEVSKCTKYLSEHVVVDHKSVQHVYDMLKIPAKDAPKIFKISCLQYNIMSGMQLFRKSFAKL